MEKKMKILFAINCLNIGGAPTVVYEQMRAIDKEKFEPYLLTLFPSKKANYFSKLDFLPKTRIKQFHLKNRSLFDIKTLIEIYKYLIAEKFDVVCTHLFLTNLIIRPLAIMARIPVIISYEHSFYYNKNLWQKIADKFLSLFTDKVIAPTPEIAEFTSRQEMIGLNKFIFIPNPVSVPTVREADKDSLRNRFNIPQDAFVILTVGRFSQEKAQIYLVRAAQKLLPIYRNFFFLMVGHGPLGAMLAEEIKKTGMGEKCRLLVEPEIAKQFLFISDIFISTSVKEGHPIAIMEAMMSETPVIASDIDGNRSVIRDRVNGLLFKSGSVDDLCEKIVFLHNNRKWSELMAREGKKSVAGYSPENNILKLESLIKSLIAKQYGEFSKT